MRLDGIKRCGEEAVVWLRDACKEKILEVKVVERKADRIYVELYDKTIEGVNVNINQEMFRLGLAKKKEA